MKTVCGLLIVLFSTATASGQCATARYSYSSYSPSYASYTPIATVVVPVAQYVAVPFYSAVYVPPATVTTTTVTAAQATVAAAPAAVVGNNSCHETALVMKEVLMEMRAMRQEQAATLRSLMPNAQPYQKKETLPDPRAKSSNEDAAVADAAIAILKKPLGMSGVSCASCHSVGQPSEKSADFHLFDANGQLRNIGESLAQSMTRKITKERKCPGAPAALTGADKDTVLKALPPLPSSTPPITPTPPPMDAKQ